MHFLNGSILFDLPKVTKDTDIILGGAYLGPNLNYNCVGVRSQILENAGFKVSVNYELCVNSLEWMLELGCF